MSKKPTQRVLEMAKIRLIGNITPNTWYQHITYTKKDRYGNPKEYPHLLAIAILSDLCYWYTPKEVRDEHTGQTIGFEKRFGDNKLQRSHDQICNKFGCSKKQSREAIEVLEKLDLSKREFRTIRTERGVIPNVMYLDINTTEIAKISVNIRCSQSVTTSLPVGNDRHNQSVRTNTETTTKTSTEVKKETKVSKKTIFKIPKTEEEVKAFKNELHAHFQSKMDERGIGGSFHWAKWATTEFYDYYSGNDWKASGKKMKSPKIAASRWFNNNLKRGDYAKICPDDPRYDSLKPWQKNTSEKDTGNTEEVFELFNGRKVYDDAKKALAPKVMQLLSQGIKLETFQAVFKYHSSNPYWRDIETMINQFETAKAAYDKSFTYAS